MKRLLFRKYFPAAAIILVVAGFVFFSTKDVRAQAFGATTTVADIPRAASSIKDTLIEAIIKAGRVSFLSSLRSLVNQFAYDTATYVGSGGQGQKPVYFTKEFGPWLREQGANVGGQFIEEFAATDQGSFIKKYNICSPDLSVSIRISLGLTDFARDSKGLSQSRCNLKQIYQSGRDQVELFTQGDYLKNLALTAFDPTTTDVGAALSLFDQIRYDSNKAEEDAKLQRIEDEGWIPAQGAISKNRTAPPQTQQRRLQQASDLQTENFFTQTGDIFVDAANIFLNQLALSAFNKLIDNLSKNSGSSSSSSNYYSQGGTGGITEVARQNSSILQARFNERADYNVLSQLSTCKDEQNPGPTECVINQQFVQAIEQNLTIAEAIQKGLLDGDARVGYNTRGDTMSYNEGYPYRSLIILRKYRVLPVGWEVAAQYIQGHSEETKDVTLSDLVACFSPNDISYPGLSAAWCRELIDPHWVLKLPKMFCGMEGYGSQIFGANVFRTGPDPDDTEVSVTRSNNYCADEQSCIKENSNGTCDLFGYCTQEKRRWIFSQNPNNSCEPRNNTCQTFKSEAGQEAAFLENTLDYDHCDAGQVGCKQYALSGPYDEVTKKITWDETGKQVYFNKNISGCEVSGEGCHQYIRIKDNLDTNIIGDASFEDSTCVDTGGPLYEGDCEIHEVNPGPGAPDLYNLPAPNDRWLMLVNGGLVTAGIVQTEVDDGTQSLYIKGNGTLYSNPIGPGITPHSFLPEDFQFEPGHYYTLSARVFPKNSNAFIGFGLDGSNHVDSTVRSQWQTLVVTFYYPFGIVTDNRVFVGSRGGEVYVDSIKLTAGRASTAYSEYGSNNVIYQKILPAYLEATCYQTGGRIPFRLKDDAPDECKKFAKKCNADEVGCESFTSLDTGITVTAKTTAQDSCPGTCIGYNTYVQQANAFNPKQAVNLIPSTARTCGAQAVGCTAFTNLDKLSQGGEAIEYYSAMRKCIKPDTTRCLPFYTWEGSDESGYQLKVYSLQKDPGSRLGEEPLSTLPAAEEALLCNATIFQKLPTEPGYNYDCRQFYAQDGTVSYHLYQKTISCSDDCHPYRRELNTASTCLAGNGDWDATQNRCLYYAIPGEGTTCAAADAGCQEYTGNIASNTRNVFTVSTFEDNTNPFEGWEDRRIFTRTNTALNLGGHSLLGDTFTKLVGEGVKRNKSYTVSFLARAPGTTTAVSDIELFNEAGDRAIFSAAGSSITTEWKLYSFNLTNLDHEVTSMPRPLNPGNVGEKLKLTFAGQIFIDNIRLTEVPNRFYLIRNSWTIPEECDQDFAGASAPGYMLGCSQYRNADSTTVNLHSFTDLCDDASAGCEAVIDTFNSTDYKAKIVNDDDNDGITEPTDNNGVCDPGEKSCIYTPADKITNVIYDRTKQCEVGNKGCQRMGLGSTYDSVTTFSDIYINNNPDHYSTTVCTAEAVGCSKWSSPDGDTYFKDPGKEVCEWRLKSGTNNQYEWYKKDTKRCGRGGTVGVEVCTQDSDCTRIGDTCQDAPCDWSYDKTVGIGGRGNAVKQPTVDSSGTYWAGLCQTEQADCTEYIDPISRFNENLIVNPGFRQADTSSTIIEGWTRIGTDEATQTISLTRQTMYILKGSLSPSAPRMRVKLSCSGVGMQVLDANNNFINQTTIDYNDDWNSSTQFYIPIVDRNNPYTLVNCQLTIHRSPLDPNPNDSVYLVKANVDYQIAKNLDKVSHNNIVNFDKGAVLFNERSQNGKNKSSLLFNADTTYDTSLDGASPDAGDVHNANVLLKVQPDRVCSKWLDCLSYIPDATNPNNKICLDIGECEAFAADGSCAARVTSKRENYSNLESIINTTGYSKVGYRDGLYNSLSDYYRLSAMSQVGETVEIKNNGFEAGDNGEWNLDTPDPPGIPGQDATILDNTSVINELGLNSLYRLSNQQRGVKYLVPEGTNILELQVNGIVKSTDEMDFQVGRRYVLTLYTYSQGGDIKIGIENSGNSVDTILTIDRTDHPHQWVKRSVGFRATAPKYKLVIENGATLAYIDDIAIESSLNIRCSDSTPGIPCTTPTLNPSDPQPQYVGPSCRLYPTENALSCAHTDENNITTKGLKGYCLEADPRNPAVCLLWYPVDRIASDPMEEGGGINFGSSSVYYCLDAQDQCSAATPQLYCDQLVKVDTDKYWAARLDENSPLKLPDDTFPETPFFYPSSTRKIDFGGEAGPSVSIPPLPRRLSNNYFGALVKASGLGGQEMVTVDSSGNINSYLPYSGTVNQDRCALSSGPYDFYSSGGTMVTNVSSSYFFGKTDTPDRKPLPGQWDVCKVTHAARLDFDGTCWDCAYSQIQDWPSDEEIFNLQHCSDPRGCDTLDADDVHCSVEQPSYRQWTAVNRDDENFGNDDAACIYYCYNRIKEVSVTQPRSTLGGWPHPLDVIKRLFPKTTAWSIYKWNGTSYALNSITLPPDVTSMGACPATGRPSITTSDTDYCYIKPEISNYKIDGKKVTDLPVIGGDRSYIVNGKKYVTFSYDTKTDKEQKPLRQTKISFGYSTGSGDAEYDPAGGNGNFADLNPRYYTKLYDYNEINILANSIYKKSTLAECDGAPECYWLFPKIHIKDNWDKFDDIDPLLTPLEVIKIIVKKPL